jgi:hypothetical protein
MHYHLYISMFVHDLINLLKKSGCNNSIPNPRIPMFLSVFKVPIISSPVKCFGSCWFFLSKLLKCYILLFCSYIVLFS